MSGHGREGRGARGLNRLLAHNEKKQRDKGVRVLRKWLRVRETVDENEMEKLWTGLFYSFWMSDKQPVQQELALRLSEMMLVLSEERAMLFFAVFLSTMQREWTGIDRLRMSKFMTLVRFFFNAMFRYLKRREWNEELCEEFLLVCEEVLHVDTLDQHRDLFLHITDVYLEEIFKVTGEEGGIPSWRVFVGLLAPFLEIVTYHSEPSVIHRVQRAILEPLFVAPVDEKHDDDDEADEDDDEYDRSPEFREFLQEHNAILGQLFFRFASDRQTPASARNLLYTLYERCDKDESTNQQPLARPSSSSSSSSSNGKRKRKGRDAQAAEDETSLNKNSPAQEVDSYVDMAPPPAKKPKQKKKSKKNKKNSSDISDSDDDNTTPELQAMRALWQKQFAAQEAEEGFRREQQTAADAYDDEDDGDLGGLLSSSVSASQTAPDKKKKKKKKKKKQNSNGNTLPISSSSSSLSSSSSSSSSSVIVDAAAVGGGAQEKARPRRRRSIQFAEKHHVKKFKKNSVVETPPKDTRKEKLISILKSPEVDEPDTHALLAKLNRKSVKLHLKRK